MKTFWEKEKERKKMKKKAVSLLMVAAMMTTMAAGCGNKAANNAGSDAAADNSTTSDAAAEETAGTEAAAVDTAGTEAAAADSEDEPWSGTITVWSPQEDQDTGWLAKECDAFNAAHPNWDITFNYGVCAEGASYPARPSHWRESQGSLVLLSCRRSQFLSPCCYNGVLRRRRRGRTRIPA